MLGFVNHLAVLVFHDAHAVGAAGNVFPICDDVIRDAEFAEIVDVDEP
jgi:hypothetical protein